MDASKAEDPTTAPAAAGTSSPRVFWVGMAVLILAVAIAGFWPTYWGPLLEGTLDLHWLVHLHGIVLSSWLVLLIVQTVLVRRGRTDLHQSVGKIVGVGWGLLVIASGLSVTFKTWGRGFDDLQDFIASLVTTFPAIVAFALLFGAALLYRKRPAIHKRLMIVATLSVLHAATARLSHNIFGLPAFPSMLAGRGVPICLAGVAIGYDWWTRRRVHPVYWVGVGVLVLSAALGLIRPTGAWADLSGQIAQWLESVLGPLM